MKTLRKKNRYSLTKSLILLVVFLQCFQAFAQDTAAASGSSGEDDIMKDSVQDISLVVGAGLGGAVLGLSTLSFYAQPGDHLKNILIGGSLGIIIGVGIVAYKQGTKSQAVYEGVDKSAMKGFSPKEKAAWHEDYQLSSLKAEPSTIGFAFSF